MEHQTKKRPFLGIDHIGLAVHDLEQATHTYSDILGFQISGSETLPERGIAVTFIETGNARFELLSPTRDNSEISGFLSKRGEGIHHICVRVENLAATLKDMVEQGANIVGNGIQTGAHGRKVAFIHPKSTHGVLLELVEIKGEATHD